MDFSDTHHIGTFERCYWMMAHCRLPVICTAAVALPFVNNRREQWLKGSSWQNRMRQFCKTDRLGTIIPCETHTPLAQLFIVKLTGIVGPRERCSVCVCVCACVCVCVCVKSCEVGKFIVSSSSLTSDFFIDLETWQLIQLRVLVEKLGHSETTAAGSDSAKKVYAFFFAATHERK